MSSALNALQKLVVLLLLHAPVDRAAGRTLNAPGCQPVDEWTADREQEEHEQSAPDPQPHWHGLGPAQRQKPHRSEDDEHHDGRYQRRQKSGRIHQNRPSNVRSTPCRPQIRSNQATVNTALHAAIERVASTTIGEIRYESFAVMRQKILATEISRYFPDLRELLRQKIDDHPDCGRWILIHDPVTGSRYYAHGHI